MLFRSQLDRIMKSYWDFQFENTKLGEIENYVDDYDYDIKEDWSGIIKKTPEGDILLVGYPSLDDGHQWFSNGPYFENEWNLFNIDPYEFNMSMLRYIQKNFGVDVSSIM